MADLPLWEMLSSEGAEGLIVAPEVLVEAVEPIFAFIVSRDECHRTEGIEVAYLVDIDGTDQPTTPVRSGTDDIGRLKSRDIERF